MVDENIPQFGTGLLGERFDKRDALAGAFIDVPTAPVISPHIQAPLLPHNQGQYPSCVGEGWSRVVEYANAIERVFEFMSGRFVYAEAKSLDGSPDLYGTWIDIGGDVVRKIGTVKEAEYGHGDYSLPYAEFMKKPSTALELLAAPYRAKPNRITFDMKTERELIKQYIAQYKLPVVTGSSGNNQSWGSQTVTKNHPFVADFDKADWSHCIVIVDWDDNLVAPNGMKGCWLIENSWSNGWGDNGRAWIPYDYKGWFNNAQAIYDLPNNWQTINDNYKAMKDIVWKWAQVNSLLTAMIGASDTAAVMKELDDAMDSGDQTRVNTIVARYLGSSQLPEIITIGTQQYIKKV